MICGGIPLSRRIFGYHFERQIGEGSTGTVWLATHDNTKSLVAIKVMAKEKFSNLEQINREIEALEKIDHPYIAQLYEVLETNTHLYIVLEYAKNGSIRDYVNSKGRMTEMIANKFFAQLLTVLDYLHNDLHIAHRDLKCENILLDENNDIRVVDFGLSHSAETLMSTFCGSSAYCAPEVVRGEEYNTNADVWSAGVVLFSVMAGNLPFYDDDVNKLFMKIINIEPSIPSYLSSQVTDMFREIFQKDPQKRITVKKLLEHPWLEMYGFKFSFDAHANQDRLVQKIIDDVERHGYNVNGIRPGYPQDAWVAYKMLKRKDDLIRNSSIYYPPNILSTSSITQSEKKKSISIVRRPLRNNLNASLPLLLGKEERKPSRTLARKGMFYYGQMQ